MNRANGREKNLCWLSSLLVCFCVLLLTPRLELGGLVGGGTLLVRFGGGLDGISRQSLLGRPVTVLVGVLAVPLPSSFTAVVRLVVVLPVSL